MFCGGCSVGINVNAARVIFNDNLTYLIDMYKQFKELGYELVLKHIRKRISEFNLSQTNVDGYYELRTLYNKERFPLDLFVLTCYSFNHQIRFNNNHELNISFGKNRSSYNKSIERNLKSFIEAIQKDSIMFSNQDFNDLKLDNLNENDFVYTDSPYLLGFGTYNEKRGFKAWTEKEETQLLMLLDKLHSKKIRFGLSNLLEHKGIKNEILDEWVKRNKYTINHLDYNYLKKTNYQTKNADKKTVEVLIINY
jgi:DNA adenine methylase